MKYLRIYNCSYVLLFIFNCRLSIFNNYICKSEAKTASLLARSCRSVVRSLVLPPRTQLPRSGTQPSSVVRSLVQWYAA